MESLAVFCGSKDGNNKRFVEHATELGKLLASHQITLVYGGGGTGLMGAVATAVLEANGRVTGVMPSLLIEREKQHAQLTELHEVDDMHARKKMLYQKSDAAVILPGGYGTLDEMFEIITWNQLKLHDIKIFLLNTDGFYDHLIVHLHMMEKEGFLYDPVLDKITIIDQPSGIFN